MFPFLEKISSYQRKDLEFFIQMPSNPSSEKELKIAQYILQCTEEGKICTNEEIINQFFHSSENPKIAWQKTKHRIQQTFLRYYTMRKLENHPLKGILLAEIYEENEQKNKKKSAIKRQKKKLENQPDSNNALYDYWLSAVETHEQGERRNSITELDTAEQKLDELYLERKFLYLIEKENILDLINSADATSNEESHLIFLEWVAKKIEGLDSIKALIYYKLYILLQKEDGIKEANEIEALIESHYENIDTQTLEEFYKSLLNYYIKNVNKGKGSYAKKYLDCLSQVLEREILFINGELSISAFKNSIGIAIVNEDTARAWKLLKQHEHKPSYSNKEKEGMYVFNFMKATILLNEEKYTQAFKTMQPYQLKDHLHDIDAQLLELQLDYSTGYDKKRMLGKIKITNIRIRHKKLPVNRKKFYLVFLKALKLLVEKKELDLSKLQGNVSILKKRWLEKMIAREKLKKVIK